jgi:hypothetical protein
MSTVSFGKRTRIKFNSAGSIKNGPPQVGPAVYAITYKKDVSARPKSHTVLFFGEAHDLSQQGPTIISNITKWWLTHGGNDSDLFMFFHEMPGSSAFERDHVQHQLVMEYDPQANN